MLRHMRRQQHTIDNTKQGSCMVTVLLLASVDYTRRCFQHFIDMCRCNDFVFREKTTESPAGTYVTLSY